MKWALMMFFAGSTILVLVTGAAPAQTPGLPEEAKNAPPRENLTNPVQGLSVTGVLRKKGVTNYMYGSHTIRDATTGRLYALRSGSSGLLDRYVGQRVVVYGQRVSGFPISYGPPLLEVYRVASATPVLPHLTQPREPATPGGRR